MLANATTSPQIAQALANNKHVDALLMANCMVDDSVAEAIAEALKTNTSISTLNLESNRITGQGVIPLARMLTVNTTLRDLRLNNQYKMVSTEAEEVIGECIVQNNTLLRFNLDIRTTHVRERVQRQLALNMDRQRQERVKDHVPDPEKANLVRPAPSAWASDDAHGRLTCHNVIPWPAFDRRCRRRRCSARSCRWSRTTTTRRSSSYPRTWSSPR